MILIICRILALVCMVLSICAIFLGKVPENWYLLILGFQLAIFAEVLSIKEADRGN